MKNKEKYNLSELTASKGRLFGKPVLHVYQGRDLKTRKEIATIRRSDECIGERKKVDLLLDWLEIECKEPILDEAEKRYLSAVIRPWRDRVKTVRKQKVEYQLRNEKEYIQIKLDDDFINLPVFDSGSMYIGMELDKRYSLEELGL